LLVDFPRAFFFCLTTSGVLLLLFFFPVGLFWPTVFVSPPYCCGSSIRSFLGFFFHPSTPFALSFCPPPSSPLIHMSFIFFWFFAGRTRFTPSVPPTPFFPRPALFFLPNFFLSITCPAHHFQFFLARPIFRPPPTFFPRRGFFFIRYFPVLLCCPFPVPRCLSSLPWLPPPWLPPVVST